jgi:hypothetical protein
MPISNETGRVGSATGSVNTATLDNLNNKQKTGFSQAQNDVRLRFLAARLHELGPQPLYYFLRELERGADLRISLERYARLPAEFIAAYGGDRFEPTASLVRGNGQ